jgi:hypothetical protein
VILAPKPKPQPVPVAVVAPPPAAVVLPTPPAPVPSHNVDRRRPARKPELPKRNLFPTVSPLTGEERLLVQLARSNPTLFESRPAEHLEIKPIEIAPIQIDGAQ